MQWFTVDVEKKENFIKMSPSPGMHVHFWYSLEFLFFFFFKLNCDSCRDAFDVETFAAPSVSCFGSIFLVKLGICRLVAARFLLGCLTKCSVFCYDNVANEYISALVCFALILPLGHGGSIRCEPAGLPVSVWHIWQPVAHVIQLSPMAAPELTVCVNERFVGLHQWSCLSKER